MPAPIDIRPTPWTTVILICGKCARKLDGGFGPKHKDSLRTTLREALKAKGHRRSVRIIETRCMGLCPRHAVTALNAGSPGRIMTIPNGTAGETALAELIGEGEH
jgi:predicted metal-binding protein